MLWSFVARYLKPLSVKSGHFPRMITWSLGQLSVRETNAWSSTLLFEISISSRQVK